MRAGTVVIVLALLWVAAFAASVLLSQAVEGPRNMDTGFKRLDTLLLWQMVAFGIAIIAAAVTRYARGLRRGIKVIGYAPLGLTILLIAAGAIGIFMSDISRPPVETEPSRPVTAVPE